MFLKKNIDVYGQNLKQLSKNHSYSFVFFFSITERLTYAGSDFKINILYSL